MNTLRAVYFLWEVCITPVKWSIRDERTMIIHTCCVARITLLQRTSELWWHVTSEDSNVYKDNWCMVIQVSRWRYAVASASFCTSHCQAAPLAIRDDYPSFFPLLFIFLYRYPASTSLAYGLFSIHRISAPVYPSVNIVDSHCCYITMMFICLFCFMASNGAAKYSKQKSEGGLKMVD